jgi:hypothetical protein
MGGRVYDAEIGRFLSADPFVDDTTNLQSLNRYSYVNNNPLGYTDPSGYIKNPLKKLGKALKKVVNAIGDGIKSVLQKIGRVFAEVPGLAAAVGAVICGPMAGVCWATFGKVMMGLNAAITLANGGTMGQVFQGAAIGLIANQIGGGLTQAFGDGLGAQAGISLFMGGMMSKAQGGKFADGVKGAAIGLTSRSAGFAARSSYEAGDWSPSGLVTDFSYELRILAGVKPPASARLSTAVYEVGQAPMFVPYSGPVANTYVPTYASVAATNTATGFTSRDGNGGFSPTSADVALAVGMKQAQQFQAAVNVIGGAPAALLCLNPAGAAVCNAMAFGAAGSAGFDVMAGRNPTPGSLLKGAFISGLTGPATSAYIRAAGGGLGASRIGQFNEYWIGVAVGEATPAP